MPWRSKSIMFWLPLVDR